MLVVALIIVALSFLAVPRLPDTDTIIGPTHSHPSCPCPSWQPMLRVPPVSANGSCGEHFNLYSRHHVTDMCVTCGHSAILIGAPVVIGATAYYFWPSDNEPKTGGSSGEKKVVKLAKIKPNTRSPAASHVQLPPQVQAKNEGNVCFKVRIHIIVKFELVFFYVESLMFTTGKEVRAGDRMLYTSHRIVSPEEHGGVGHLLPESCGSERNAVQHPQCHRRLF